MAVEFALSGVLRLRPDACVFLEEKARSLDYDLIPIPGAPDLAIDVISPEYLATESQEKLTAYLRNGTAEVWQVFPKSRTIWIHRSEGSRTLDASQTLASDLLPGFEAAVQSFFAD